jgi:8-oxo-dGDP phosphatase
VEQLGSRTVYSNPWMTVVEDDVVHSGGATGTYAYVDKPDFALVIPYDGDAVWLVEEFRYPVGGRRWSFPQGSRPPGVAGGDAEALARAELAEETGLRARDVVSLGRLEVAHGLTRQGMHVFLATDLLDGVATPEPTELDIVCRRVGEADLVTMMRDGRIVDACSLAAYALWRCVSRR